MAMCLCIFIHIFLISWILLSDMQSSRWSGKETGTVCPLSVFLRELFRTYHLDGKERKVLERSLFHRDKKKGEALHLPFLGP